MARAPDEPICPACGLRVRVPPAPGEACDDCRSAKAWTEFSGAGRRLVIDDTSIAEAESRRAGEDAGTPAWRRAAAYAPAAVSAVLAALALAVFLRQFSPLPISPLADLIGTFRSEARWGAAAGFAALAAGVTVLLVARRGRLFRSWPVVTAAGAAIAVGTVALAAAVLSWGGLAFSWTFEHDAAPPVPASPASPVVERIMRATVVILASGADGNARYAGVGSGAVIRTEPGRAWIVTCSHVAMPEVSPGAVRDPETAAPVWVHLADGRSAEGRVRWTAPPPLDVAVVSCAIDDPPEPVEVARDDDLPSGGDVQFVPNPFRDGWLRHRGAVVRREPHATPAGPYSLIFTDLPVQQGDSGSGLFDGRGRLVGVNTWRAGDRKNPVGICLPASALAGALDDAARAPAETDAGGTKPRAEAEEPR